MTQAQHKNDWYVSGDEFQTMIISEQTGDTIAVCYSPQKGTESAQANAKFIVRACNVFNDDMLEALDWCLSLLDTLEIHKNHNGIVSNALNEHGKVKWESAKELLQKARGEI